MKAELPQSLTYQAEGSVRVDQYTVVFWYQFRADRYVPASGRAVEMSWEELTFELSEVVDVSEAMQWAEQHVGDHFDPAKHAAARYVLYARNPEPQLALPRLELAGSDPTSGKGRTVRL